VVRWAWRLFRREWRQQLLVLSLLTLAVAATFLGAAVATNTPPPPNVGFGTAEHLVTLPDGTGVAALRAQVGTVDVIESKRMATGVVGGAELRAQDPHGPYGGPMLDLLSGRYPAGPDEVAMTRDLASTFAVRVGDTWDGRRLVGLVQNPQNLLDAFALVVPGQVTDPDRVTVLFDGTTTLPGVQSPTTSSGIDPAVIVLLVAVFGLVFVGLVAAAGFTVLAQRRRRAFGTLAALGATERHVRLALVANGAVVGAAAAVAGTVLGLAAWIAYVPSLQTGSHHRITWTHLPWWLVATSAVLAVGTAVLAAQRPARAAARLSVVAAVSGRPAPPKPVHRSALPGAVLVGCGLVLLALSGGWSSQSSKDSLFKLGGLLSLAVGVLLFAPACLTMLGAGARRAPVAVRLALRDLARFRSRSGPALAAISFAILIATVVSLLATARYADPLDYFGPNLAANQMIVYVPGQGPGERGPDAGTSRPAGTDPQAVATWIATTLETSDVLALQTSDGSLLHASGGRFIGYPGRVFVATPQVLSHYGIDPGEIRPDTLLVTSRDNLAGLPGLVLAGTSGPEHCDRGGCVTDPRIQRFTRLPADASGPNLLVTEHAVQALHLTVAPIAWLVRAARPLTATQINTARQAAAATGMTIETKSEAPSLAQLRDDATVAGLFVALAVLAMTVGLIRGEAGRDLRTLTANGASARTRRAITAATAGALGLVGALVGTLVGYLAVIALFRSDLAVRLGDPPVLDTLIVVVGLPLVASAGGWLLAGREVLAHQPSQ
jgi:putative ABC transport system permease protein